MKNMIGWLIYVAAEGVEGDVALEARLELADLLIEAQSVAVAGGDGTA